MPGCGPCDGTPRNGAILDAMFEDLLAYLEKAGVRFVVVGGLAVVIQGYARLTADVDLVLDLDSTNVRRAVAALTARGLRPLLPVAATDSMRDENNPLLTVDLFAREPMPFEDLWSRADEVVLGQRPIRVACIDDLIAMKRAAGRPQDLADVQHLEQIARRRRG